MTSAAFQRLEDELDGHLSQLQRAPPYLISNITQKAKTILAAMEVEFDKTPPENRAAMQSKIRQYRHEIECARQVPEAGGLGRAIRVAAETETIGEEVGVNLRGQREQLLRTRDRLQEAGNELTRAGRLITAIRFNVISNKMFLIFIIIIEVAILLSLCYLKFIKR